MEDESPELALILLHDPAFVATRVDRLHLVAADVLALATAALALARSIGNKTESV